MRKVIASLMLMASIPCQASWDDWSDSDKAWGATALAITDRKSTRLNSSH